MLACDFCGHREAILYCRADTAKLCLSCDHHVHSDNALSKKHLRSQICNNCHAEPASVRCATDALLLCQDCDWDAHGSCLASAAHDRCPVQPFSGCSSALHLAAAWGFKFGDEKTPACEWGSEFLEELMVPTEIYSDDLVKKERKNRSPSCGKQKQVILKQLLDLLTDGGGGGSDVGPRTPGSCGWQQENFSEVQLQGEEEGGGFTSLLMTQTSENPKEEVNALWNGSFCDRSSQIWDLDLGQLRGSREPGTLDLECGGSDMAFNVKSYEELLKETSLAKRRRLDLSAGLNYSNEHENIIPFNNTSNNHGPATSESSSLPLSKPSPYSGFAKPSRDLLFTDQPDLIKIESVSAMTKADMELLAKNRGNAVQRYKEKKKTRRYDKRVRYESRKARADTRKRVKGRFVKANEAPAG